MSLRALSWLPSLVCVAATVVGCGGGGAGGGSAPAAPSSVAVAPTQLGGELNVTWAPVAGATFYRVHWSLTPGIAANVNPAPGEIAMRGTAETSMLLAALDQGGPYYVAVTAVNASGDSPFSVERAGLPLPSTPETFALTGSAAALIASWSPVVGATAYELFVAMDPTVTPETYASLPGGAVVTTPSTLATLPGLENGATYWGVVRAVNASGASPATASRSATPSARGTFVTGESIPVGDSPQGSVVALLDADAHLDIAVVDEDGDAVSVFLGNGDGTFTFDAAYPTGAGPVAVIAVDLDGDGGLELVTANGGDGTASVLDGDGLGGFADRVDWVVGGSPAALASGSLDPAVDSTVDLVVTDVVGAQVAVLFGAGDETFWDTRWFSTGAQPVFVHLADVDGDGDADVLTANAPAGTVSALLDDGFGDLSTRFDSLVGVDCTSLDTGDFDGDGTVDVVVTSALTSSVSFLHGNGDGTFLPTTPVGAGFLAEDVVAGDFDGDGLDDLVVVSPGDGSVHVLLGDGAGGFQPFYDLVAGAGASRTSVGDFNGDGILDLVVTTTATGEVTILLGSK